MSVKRDEITPPQLFFSRRRWMQSAALVASLPITAAFYRFWNPVNQDVKWESLLPNMKESTASRIARIEKGFDCREWRSSFYDITHLNNFHEFTTDQQAVAAAAQNFHTNQWRVEIGGLVERPIVLTMDDIHTMFPSEERVYRLRCVEGWSMVVPWAGFPLSALLEKVRPLPSAKFVAFETLLDRDRFPNQVPGELQWPYAEGLRLDEAMHPLTLIATGVYRRELPAANGAPLRLVVPWKYGFKSIKSLVKIDLVDSQPETAWNKAAAHENGFYANVNPNVDHPRWSQATERRVGELLRRKTLMFNGYEKQVESLYRGMDLSVDF